MPSTYTHRLYGRQVLENLDKNTQSLINKYIDYYNIGLHGPDILFYYKPLSKNPICALGYHLHEIPAKEFFEHAKEVINKSTNKEASLVYILGFINHFTLDSECHPFINQFVIDSKISHVETETEIDRYLMVENGLDPLRTQVASHIKSTDEIAEVIAPFFNLTPKDIKEALRSMVNFLNLFIAPNPMKRKGIFLIMKLVKQYDYMHGLIVNYSPNPKCKESTQEVLRRMKTAIPVSVQLIEEVQDFIQNKKSLSNRYERNYE